MLLNYLENQRAHVVSILEGLTEEELRRPLVPSGWSCLSLVKHLALDVEHYWFQCIVAGDSLDYFRIGTDTEVDAWKIEPTESSEDVLTLYRQETERANAIIASTELDAVPRQVDPSWGEWAPTDLRYIMLHVITETACHAGHLDVARELLDGHQYLVL